MVRSRSRRRPPSGAGSILEPREAIREYLARKLPPGKADQIDYLTGAVLKIGAVYDRYATEENRRAWLDYAARRKRFERIAQSIQALLTDLYGLDILSRDDLSSQIDPCAVDTLMGSLLILSKETTLLAKETQKSGRPRDLAEERWILALADIYENAFSKPARVWRSSDDRQMSDFYRLLELCRPETFPRHGKLSRRQVDRVLSLRKKHNSLTNVLKRIRSQSLTPVTTRES